MKNKKQQVILLHGLGRSPRSMRKIERKLIQENYRVLNIGYNGITNHFNPIVNLLLKKISSWLDPNVIVHFVGHSFGGILIRGILAQQRPWTLGRCIMLGSPNKGSLTASYLLANPILKYFTPLVTQQLTPDSTLMKVLPEPNIETGIIAGNKPFNAFIPVTWFYKKATNGAPGDGIVEISSTQCSNMSDFILLPLHHSFMMGDSDLIQQILHFLNKGRFIHPQKAES